MQGKGNKNNIYLKYLKKTLLSVIALFLSFIIIIALVAFFNQEKIKNYIIEELNKQLDTELLVEKIDFSVFKRFPYASVVFYNVTAKDAVNTKNKGDLLKASNIYMQFNLWNLLRAKYKISRIEITDAHIRLIVFKDGTDNYHFWKTSDTTNENSFSFYLQKVLLNNTHISYVDYIANNDYSIYVKQSILNGHFASEEYSLYTSANCFIYHIKTGENIFLHNKNVDINFNLDVNNNTANYILKNSFLSLGNMNFNVDGNWISNNNEQNIDININGKNINLSDFIKEIPNDYKSFLNDFDISGNIDAKCNLKGSLKNNNIPAININAELKKGKFKQKSTGVALENLNFSFAFDNGASRNPSSYSIIINNINGKLKNGNIAGNIKLKNIKRPEIILNLNANLELKDLNSFLKIDTIQDIKGSINGNIFFKGQANASGKFTAKDFVNSEVNGNINISDCNVKFINSSQIINNLSGNFVFNNNDVNVNNLKGYIEIYDINNNTSVNDFSLTGSFTNLLPYLFIKNQSLNIDADFISNNIEMNKLLSASNNSSPKTEKQYYLELPEDINFNLNVNIKNFSFDRFKATDASGKIILNNKQIEATKIRFYTMDGYIMASGLIDNNRNNNILLSCDLNLEKVNINKLFYQFYNFGQESMKDNNLKGKVNAQIQFAAFCNNSLNIDVNTVYVKTSINIENGELINYKPVQGLSSYIKGRDLSHIKFSSLKNEIEIKDRIIYIPSMEIKSSALNMTLNGNHNFDNEIEYHIGILLSELKNPDKTKKEEEFGPIEDDGLHKGKYYFLITGTVDNPIYKKIDKTAYKEKIITDIKKEKENLREILNKEFGWGKKDSVKKGSVNSTKEKDEFKKKEGSGFIFEWEED
jgi:hypothetical protein